MPYLIQFRIAGTWRGTESYDDVRHALQDMDFRDEKDRRGYAIERRVVDGQGNVMKLGRWCSVETQSEETSP